MFKVKTISETKKFLLCNSEEEAQQNLEIAVQNLLKDARWFPYYSKINELRKPLLQLKLARRKIKK